ncbi:flavin reductase family protein [Jatrophihabitans cynanchi]|uniref:Flavin reductase family protein n=2 Tax=Jatrophihabitans cynanchi TaxID=2944128 RepID=A0ABY7K1L4_9ACTN|nr:flavin reductase family protein [Jatrophihabitans sp. SB3-54]WAX58564.1 flavin reductase family protein [Jatrophihabitans sp. SB3-54]
MDAFATIAARLDYPMFVVTTAAGDERAGCLVGFATQASIEPARFLVGLSDKNHTYRVARDADRLAVHLLSRRDEALAELFGEHTGDREDKFARCGWHRGPGDVPILDGAAAWFSGPIVHRAPLGDHTGFLIEPDAGECSDLTGVIMFRDVQGLDPGHDA